MLEVKRRVLYSVLFNVGYEESAFSLPVVTIYYNCKSDDVEIRARFEWVDLPINKNIPIKLFLEKTNLKNLSKISEYYLREIIPTYTKKIRSKDEYISPFLKEILGSK